ncbi:heterotrimeric G-protein alpha subunit, GPA3-like protein [Pluteus cervinus]|uniref:Heterotrimeric G-protein alpha subunit, GPA3-like protein n=1 Tax=Pluteus cervinus TaxID=181527 RepID=A0ACD3ATJ0_9AGAR|nr:heterotrimeric G-protein alpha subunit, GPA3-like protein [Pluteus cervinus]
MGSCVSTANSPEKARSDAIDKQIEQDSKREKRNCKVLLLGSAGSGKTTIVKQMKIIHQGGFSPGELADWRPIVYKNLLESAKAVVLYMRKVNLECQECSNRALAEKILNFKPPNIVDFTPEIADAIHQVWNDPVILKIMNEHTREFYLMDSAPYFFSEVLRIGAPNYIPNEVDVLRARQQSTGTTATCFSIGTLSIRMVDVGGQRSERKKWIHCFESVTSIIFCTALSEYDQTLLEEQSQNRMLESLLLFESIINSRWFRRTSVVLFLNKIDVFKNKLPKIPLERFFPEYTGGTDINKAAKYILCRFMQVNRARLRVYPHLTQATDTTIIRLVFATVNETILQNALRDSEIL